MSEVKPLHENLGFQHVSGHGGDTIESLCHKVDAAGGWNPNAVCVQFCHSIEDRYCIFSDLNVNTGWWTTVLTIDEYYWHKISQPMKQKIRADIVRDIKWSIA